MTHATRVGAAQVILFSVGEIEADLFDWLRPASPVPAPHDAYFAHLLNVPVQCALIVLPETVVLVDAPRPDPPPGRPKQPDLAHGAPDLAEQMLASGYSPQMVEHVVITHTHFDHYSGTTTERDKVYTPTFPNARYYVNHLDWEQRTLQRALRRRNSEDSRTLGVLADRGRLVFVDGPYAVTTGLDILPAPGETPGHQLVRLRSEAGTFYCIGDLYHHVVEIEQPELVAHWNDRAATLASRAMLVEAALAEDALIMATHIPGFGKLTGNERSLRWVTVAGH